MLILSMIKCIQNLVSICLFVLKILSKNQIVTSIKGRNSDANLRKTMIYITNVDLVNDYVYTILVTCKYEEYPIKNEGTRVVTTLYINILDAKGQITQESAVVYG